MMQFIRRLADLALWLLAVVGVVCALVWGATALGHIKPLIVISGSMEPGIPTGDLLIDVPVETASLEVGDVVIAPDVVDAQREMYGTTFEQEASLMLVHSILHLLGYDHIEDDEAEVMEAKEKEILDAYGLTGIR